MADHEIGAILTLRDNMSATLRGVRGEQAAFRRDAQETQETMGRPMEFKVHAAEAARMIAGIGLAAGAAALAVGGLALNFGDDLKKSLNGAQAATGATDEAIAGMKDTMLAIYNNNFGENFAEIGNVMGLVTQQTDLTGEALQKMTEGAFVMRDAFEMDVAGSVETAGVMMKNFGIDSDQAYNLIAQGAQKGLNKQGDLLDVLKEYGPHFAKLGFSAEESMNMLANGAAGGVFSVDQLGDVVHEFGRKMREEDLSKPLQELGLNSEKYTGMVAKGGETAKQAFQEIAGKVAAIEDPVKRNQVGIGIFGDMMGEVGIEGVLAMANTKGAISKTTDALGKINAVKYNTFGEAMTGIKRNLETGILLPLSDKVMPKVNAFAGWITSNMPVIKNEISYAMDVASEAFGAVSDTANATIIPAFNFIYQTVSDHMPQIRATTEVAFDAISSAGTKVSDTVKTIGKEFSDHKTAIEVTAGVITVLFIPALIASGVEAVLSGAKIAGSFVASIISTGVESVIAGVRMATGVIASTISYAATGIKATASIAGMILKIGIATISFVAHGIAVGAISAATGIATAAQWALNAAMSANPIGAVILLIVGLVAAGVLLYKNWDTIKEKVADVGTAIENGFKTGVNGAIGVINGLIEAIRHIPGFGDTPLIAKIAIEQTTTEKRSSFDAMRGIDNNAGGTDNFRGGLTWVGEEGPEILNLPGGSQIIPNNEVSSYVSSPPPFDGYIEKISRGSNRIQPASDNPYNGGGGSGSTPRSSKTGGVVVNMYGTTIREEADIGKVADAILLKIDDAASNS